MVPVDVRMMVMVVAFLLTPHAASALPAQRCQQPCPALGRVWTNSPIAGCENDASFKGYPHMKSLSDVQVQLHYASSRINKPVDIVACRGWCEL